MLTVGRSWSVGSEYRYGWNTQERTDEVSGSGNHYTALFWEYSPRVVQRWNLDPKPNPSFSPYAIMQGNPIWYTDHLGDTVAFNSFRARLKVGVNSLFNKEFRADVKELKASEETYVFKGSDQLNGGGHTSTDGDDIFINYSWNNKDRTLGTGRATSLFHETEHGIQFEHGEIGFRNTGKGWTAINYDLTDEMGAMRAGSFSPGSILKDYNGNNTFQGDMRSLGTNMSSPTVVQNNSSILLRYYQNQPNATYNTLIQTPLNNTQVNSRLNNGQYFMRPLTPRGR